MAAPGIMVAAVTSASILPVDTSVLVLWGRSYSLITNSV